MNAARWIMLATLGGLAGGESPAQGTLTATLNGLDISLDERTGAIRGLVFEGPGVLLEAEPEEAGLVDVAYPMERFEALRLAARHSEGARIEQADDRVTIHLDRMGPSRPGFETDGAVSATVELRADPDGRSIVLSCSLRNDSALPVRQVVFPELRGLIDVAGPDNTILKACGFGAAPFRELHVSDTDTWYAVNNSIKEYTAGGMFSPMWGRWIDLGGLNGGLSIFPRRWGWDPQVPLYAQLRQQTQRLRLLWAHTQDIAPGETWHSGEWVLTPHRAGWAKGIEPYREWVRQNAERKYSIPRHIREGLGFRTVWMCQNQPADPADAVWRFADLPDLAREAHDHGLTEMVLWSVAEGFDASLPPPFPHLGTQQELVDAAAACRDLGVNVVPFVSVLQASPRTAGRYGLAVTSNNGWTYHTEMIPRWNPPYATGLSCVQVGPGNAQWQDEVAASLRRWADLGLASVAWDQYWTDQTTPSMQDLTARVRDYARTVDPEATFSGEELWSVEVDCEYLDYTWNWTGYRDCQAFVNAFPGPRPNVNINRSPAEAKFAFMDNLFLNVWPAKLDGINGSEWIGNVPELSAALKECAALRRQFLSYFTEGTYIGACLMPEVAPGVRMGAYVMPDRVLALVLNQGPGGRLAFRYDLTPWLHPAGTVILTRYDATGGPLETTDTPMSGALETADLPHLGIEVFEFATP